MDAEFASWLEVSPILHDDAARQKALRSTLNAQADLANNIKAKNVGEAARKSEAMGKLIEQCNRTCGIDMKKPGATDLLRTPGGMVAFYRRCQMKLRQGLDDLEARDPTEFKEALRMLKDVQEGIYAATTTAAMADE